MLQVLGLKLLKLGSHRKVDVMMPPSWVTQTMEPYKRKSTSLPVNTIGKLGAWCLMRGNRLAEIRKESGAIKVLLP